jgi:hypothetical protein
VHYSTSSERTRLAPRLSAYGGAPPPRDWQDQEMVGRRWLYHREAGDASNRLPNPARRPRPRMSP